VDELKAPGKPFVIAKWAVWEAYEKVKANKGAPGVDAVSLETFEQDLRNNLYKIWNRMSSGTYFPPPVRAVEIPKTGGGVRMLGVPTVADRIAQTVAARVIEAEVEKIFHPGLVRLPAWTIGDRRGSGMPHTELAERLGDRSGHPEVLRHGPVGPAR
jgi:RNA-directed DNA polymerase